MAYKGFESTKTEQTEDVPQWRAFPVQIEESQEADRSRRIAPWLGALLGLLGIVAIAATVLLLDNAQSDAGDPLASEKSSSGDDASGELDSGASQGDSEESSGSVTGSESSNSTDESTGSQQVGAVDDAYAQAAWGRVDQLQLVLQGALPSQEMADAVEARAAEVIGEAFVVSDYEIDPDAPTPTDPPLFIPLTIQFSADGSIHPGSEPTMRQAVFQFTMFDTARVTITADPLTKPDDPRLTLEQAEAIAAYWEAEGLSPDRIEIEVAEVDGTSGQDEPTATDGPDNRQVEFIIRGLLTADVFSDGG